MTIRFELYNQFYSGGLSCKLAMARNLYEKRGKTLQAEPMVAFHLAAAQEKAYAVSAQMANMNMGVRCARCASQPGGGCCSRFMANENDVLQLLMNLLAGKEVMMQHDDNINCSFLGMDGCILTFKPLFCLNYLCSHIKENEKADSLALLEQRTGDLLQTQIVLERLLLDFFINIGE